MSNSEPPEWWTRYAREEPVVGLGWSGVSMRGPVRVVFPDGSWALARGYACTTPAPHAYPVDGVPHWVVVRHAVVEVAVEQWTDQGLIITRGRVSDVELSGVVESDGDPARWCSSYEEGAP